MNKARSNVVSEPIHVVNVCETVKGGIATYLRLVDEATARGAQHHFILPESQSEELSPNMNATTFDDPGRGLRRLWRLFTTTLHITRKGEYGVVFFHSTFTLPVMVMLRLFRVPGRFVYCAHGWAALRYEAGSRKRRVVAWAEGLMSRFSDVVVNISSFDLRYARAAGYGADHRLLENAVSEYAGPAVVAPYDREGRELNILFIGRFDRQKGLDVLLASFSRVQSDRPDLRLHIVGESVLGDCQNGQHATPRQNVSFHGWQRPAAVHGFCEAADIVVVPSRWEGFGLVVAEAFRAGTPVLVSDRGALPDLVEPGQTGFVSRLSVVDFAAVLQALDKQQLAAMRPACRASYETRFHSERFGRELSELFKELVAR